MRILALDAALGRCAAAIVAGATLIAARQSIPDPGPGGRGQTALLAGMADDVLREAGITARDLDLVAVTVGPGSFTGIRAALSLAHGIALAAGVPLIGVTVGEALGEALAHLGGRVLWSAIDSRRGRVFLERASDGATAIEALALSALPAPGRPVAVAGNAAPAVAAALAARGADVMLTDARLPLIRHVALVALRRHRGALPPLTAQPVYVDPPEATPPAGGLRPPPLEQ